MQPRFAISNIFLISMRVNVSLKVEVISKNQTIITISSQKTLKINYCHCQTRANAEDMIQYEIRKSIWNYINLHKILKIIFVQFKVSVWSIRKGRKKSLQWKFPFEGGLEDDRNDARRLVSQTPSPQEKNLPLKRSLPSLFPAKGSKRGGKSKGEGGGGKRESAIMARRWFVEGAKLIQGVRTAQLFGRRKWALNQGWLGERV